MSRARIATGEVRRVAGIIRAATRALSARGKTSWPGSIVATKRQVEGKLRELLRRLDGADRAQGALADALPEPRVIQVSVTDLDAVYWTELERGKMGSLHRGAAKRADMKVQLDSDQLLDLVDGEKSLFSAYVKGQVKIQASP